MSFTTFRGATLNVGAGGAIFVPPIFGFAEEAVVAMHDFEAVGPTIAIRI